MRTELPNDPRTQRAVRGHRIRMILGILDIAFGLYMLVFTVIMMIRGDYETVPTMGGGILVCVLGGVFLLNSDPRSSHPKV
jgi:hypothetical protein